MKTHHHRKNIINIALALALAATCHAQDTDKTPPNDAPQDDAASFLDSSTEALGAVTNQAKKSAEDHIAKRGWQQGLNPDGKYVAIGIAPISVKPTDYQFATMRVNAYTKAMLDAKAGIARFIATEIKTAVLHNYGTTSEIKKQREEADAVAARKNASIPAKIKMLVSAKLDNLLRDEGVAIDSPQAAEKAGKLLNQDSFSQLIESSARSFVAGLICGKIFEENGQIAVVAYYSDNSRMMADAIAGKGNAPKVAPREGDPLRMDRLAHARATLPLLRRATHQGQRRQHRHSLLRPDRRANHLPQRPPQCPNRRLHAGRRLHTTIRRGSGCL